jgi:SAM-dependent methyltransferase
MPTLVIPRKFNRSGYRNVDRTTESALFLIAHVCRLLGIDDLADNDVLDVGCGTKFTDAFINQDVAIKSYVGVDVYSEMIAFLHEKVTDPRFEYHHIDVKNELYNPDAPPMTETTDLGVGDRTFDVIWLFSVFTHLAPHDYRTMLKLLRRRIRPDGRLIYTLFVDELTEGGHGFTDHVHRALSDGHSTGPAGDDSRTLIRDVRPFVDVDPEHPLRCALYSREHAYELIEGTGWQPLELLPPNEYAQHHFVCAPV